MRKIMGVLINHVMQSIGPVIIVHEKSLRHRYFHVG